LFTAAGAAKTAQGDLWLTAWYWVMTEILGSSDSSYWAAVDAGEFVIRARTPKLASRMGKFAACAHNRF
jgi:hypothetical protein